MATANNSLVFTQDIRAAAQDYKRDSNNKHKWELGETFGPGRAITHPKPRRPSPKQKVLKVHAAKTVHRKGIVADYDELSTDSSCDEEVMSPDAAPAVDAEITYSYDAAKGPSHGSQVLAGALDKAMAKFENNVTDRLVRDEYEVLGADGDTVVSKTGKKQVKAAVAQSSADEDDYEFV